MKRINHIFYTLGLAATLGTAPAIAQNATEAHPMIVTPHVQKCSYLERTLCLNVQANVDYEVACDQEWATIRKGDGGTLLIHIQPNYNSQERVALITLSNDEKGVSQTIVLTQQADASALSIPTDIEVKPSGATDTSHASGTYDGPASYTLDGNTSTVWHTAYGTNKFVVSETNPAILTYTFSNVDRIDYINYVPRQDGNSNGNFGHVKVYVKQQGDADFRLYNDYNWGFGSSTQTINFGEGGLANPAAVKFEVLTGYGDFATCAEMEFRKRSEGVSEFSIFADDVYSTLREGVTADDIDRIKNPFVKSLATKIFNGQYTTDYRVATFPCLLNVNTLSSLWNCPGKLYDQNAGVTGISYGPGSHAIMVSGLPAEKSLKLRLIAWYNGYVGGNFDGGNPQVTTFTLQNGLNVIQYNPEKTISYKDAYCQAYHALAYIVYDDVADPDAYPDVKVHFINGVVNGYLSADKTNDEMDALTANAPNSHMDVVGKKVHSVWSSEGLNKYCKSITGAKGYRQYINVIDSLIQWEHDVLGFTKYNRLPENRTFAYVNYTYYMFQGGMGVSFHQDQERRVLNCNTLVNNDDDALWGLSHEWGHQHQMHPYFCWKGVNEVTNNVNSYYNIMKMGYRKSDKINQWVNARKHFVQGNLDGVTLNSAPRKAAYNSSPEVSWCPDYAALVNEMKNDTIYPVSVNKHRALSINEVGVGETLCPFIMLYVYFTRNGFPDFAPDWYEALRQTDQEGGSTVEKSGGYDKYELVAAAQNNNKNGAIAKLNQLFPNSVWCKYITEAHCSTWNNNMPYILNWIVKCSRLTGYNLFPYFERWGFLRQTALYIGDYGNGWQIFTPAAYDEFKADMDALVANGTLKELSEEMVVAISNSPDYFQSKPTFPN